MRRFTPRAAVATGFVIAVLLSGCGAPLARTAPRTRAATPKPTRPPYLNWDDTIGPLLNDRCVSCHGQIAGLSYATYESALRGSMNGPVIIPGDPVHSKIVIRQSAGDHPMQLTPEQLTLVKEWIAWGAPEK